MHRQRKPVLVSIRNILSLCPPRMHP